MKTLLRTSSILMIVLLLGACVSGGDSGNPQSNGDGTTNNNTGGSSGGGSGSGGSGSGSGGDTSAEPVLGTLAALYQATNQSLNTNSCGSGVPATIVFQDAVFKLVNQTSNDVIAAITLTPDGTSTTAFDQLVINVSGTFTSAITVEGNVNILASANGQIVDALQSSGTFTIMLDSDNTISFEFVAPSVQAGCSYSGTIRLSAAAGTGGGGTGSGGTGGGSTGGGDTGTGGGSTGGGTGGTGGGTGGTGGGTGGTGGGTGGTGGGTGGSGTGDVIVVSAEGDFGSLQFQSSDTTEDGAFATALAMYLRRSDGDLFLWSNQVDIVLSVNVVQGSMNINAASGINYDCTCFPLIDLVNNTITFNQLVLSSSDQVTLTIDGVLSFPPFN